MGVSAGLDAIEYEDWWLNQFCNGCGELNIYCTCTEDEHSEFDPSTGEFDS